MINNIIIRYSLYLVMTISLIISKDYSLGQEAQNRVSGPTKKRINFGVVLNNNTYTIYRSAALGKSGLKTLQKHLQKEKLPFPKTIVYMNKNGYKFPFYFSLQEFFAERSKKYGTFKFYHPFGKERTYLDGHNPYYPEKDIDSKSILGRHARKYFELKDDGVDGGIENLMRILNIVLNPSNQPVLFHCHGGKHRTGMVALIIRYLQGGWWTDDFYKKRWRMDLNPAQYEYYKYNKLLFRKDNLYFVEDFSNDQLFYQLDEKYGEKIRELN